MTATTGGFATKRSEQPAQPLPEKIARFPEQVQLVLQLKLSDNYNRETPIMPTTKENLKNAFAGESQAFQKYAAFAKKAEKEGLVNIAKLFRTTAEAERIHAEGHLAAADGIESTVDNLVTAIGGETYEHNEMYPPMYEQAVAEGHKAKRMFGYAVEAEKIHAELYRVALEAAKNGRDLDTAAIWLCPVCGHIELGTPPEACPICKVKASVYVQVD